MKNIDFQKLVEVLQYQKQAPLLFNSGLFLFLFLGFTLVYSFLQHRKNARIWFTVFFSLYFYYKSSGWYLVLMLLCALLNFVAGISIDKELRPLVRKYKMIGMVVINLGILAYYKYFNFFIETANQALGYNFSFTTIFLPLGISFFTFELICYVVDIYQKKVKAEPRIGNFLFYVSFFPHLVAGPIMRPKELLPQIAGDVSVSKSDVGKGIYLIVLGLIKKAIISDYISTNFVDRVFDNPTLYSGTENLLAVYGYTVQIFCDFSGYSDMAIGIAFLLGFSLPENFNSPYLSSSVTDFWRRWHITLSHWLRDYLYIPMGGNKGNALKTNYNLLMTMLLGGLWHGASWKFVFWGFVHGSFLVIEKNVTQFFNIPKNSITSFLGWIYTFHVVAFCWIFFRAADFSLAMQVIQQITTGLNIDLFRQIIAGYEAVFVLLSLGLIIGFIPKKWHMKGESFSGKLPLIVQALLLALTILAVNSIRSADVQPFIYFQF